MYTNANMMAPAIKFQGALNRKTEEVSPAKQYFFVFRYKCYISYHNYKMITNSILYFGLLFRTSGGQVILTSSAIFPTDYSTFLFRVLKIYASSF
jgi:hypothetical protein